MVASTRGSAARELRAAYVKCQEFAASFSFLICTNSYSKSIVSPGSVAASRRRVLSRGSSTRTPLPLSTEHSMNTKVLFFACFFGQVDSQNRVRASEIVSIFCAAPSETIRGALGVRDGVLATIMRVFLEENWFRGFSLTSTSRILAFSLLEKHKNVCPELGLCHFLCTAPEYVLRTPRDHHRRFRDDDNRTS